MTNPKVNAWDKVHNVKGICRYLGGREENVGPNYYFGLIISGMRTVKILVSVARFGGILPLWQKFKSFCQS